MATNSYINYSLFHIDNMAECYPTAPQVVDPLVKTLSEVEYDTRELETMTSHQQSVQGLCCRLQTV